MNRRSASGSKKGSMSDDTKGVVKGWGKASWLPLVAGTLVLGALMLGVFRKDKTMKELKKIRDALRFATDAAVPRVQVEATLALAEVASELLDEIKAQGSQSLAATRDWKRYIDEAKELHGTERKESFARSDEELALFREIRVLLYKLAGEPVPEPPAEALLGGEGETQRDRSEEPAP